MLAQGITIVAGLISVPLTIGYLGLERYGIWLTINSFLQWVYITNLGLSGNALINKLSEANGKDDRSLAQELVATAFWTLAGLSVILLLLFAVCFPFINWTSVFNVGETVSSSELQLAIIFAFVSFVLMFPTSMVDGVYQGYQEGFIGDIWNIVGSISSLIVLIIVTQYQGGLPILVASLFGVKILFSFINAGYLFFIRHPWLKPVPRAVKKKSYRELINLGWKYLAAQLAGIGMFQSQPFILTQILGPESVGIFMIIHRLITLPLLIVNMFSFPFMPAYGEAKARNDWKWIEKNLRRIVPLAGLGAIATVIPIAFFAKTIIYYWVGTELIPPDRLIAALAIYTIIVSLVSPISVMLYGVERVGGQALIAFTNAVLNVLLGIIFTNLFGLIGIGLAMLVAFSIVNPLGQFIQVHTVFKAVKKNKKEVSQ